MSDTSQGEGWWLASDGKWYPPESRPAWPPPQSSPWGSPAGSPETPASSPGSEPGGAWSQAGQSTQPPGIYPPWGYQPPQPGSPGSPGAYPPGSQYQGAYPPAAGYGYPYGPPGYVTAAGPRALIDQQTGLALAPWWKRLVAIIVDFLVLSAFFFVIDLAGGAARTGATKGSVGGGSVILLVAEVVVAILYYAILNGSNRGQTIGKMAMSIACRDARSGGPIGFWRALARYLIELVFEVALILPFLLDCLSPLWDRRRQAWHDHVVKSIVVETDRPNNLPQR
jgi:uncharacterized RDD family membrane protein YckC